MQLEEIEQVHLEEQIYKLTKQLHEKDKEIKELKSENERLYSQLFYSDEYKRSLINRVQDAMLALCRVEAFNKKLSKRNTDLSKQLKANLEQQKKEEKRKTKDDYPKDENGKMKKDSTPVKQFILSSSFLKNLDTFPHRKKMADIPTKASYYVAITHKAGKAYKSIKASWKENKRQRNVYICAASKDSELFCILHS